MAFGVALVTASVGIVSAPVGGLLADRFGRRPLMKVPAMLLVILIIPVFRIVVEHRTAGVLYGLFALLELLYVFYVTSVLVAVTELLPPRVRSGTLATIYAVAAAIFGGSTPFVATWLIQATGSPLAPAFYWTVAMLVGCVFLFALPESAPRKLGEVS
ncbi:MAG: MFS transporter [Pararobbsia sp.]